MSTRGWESATLADVVARTVVPARSKYRNVKVTIDGITFDSRREAAYWQGLKARERNGEITDLQRQVIFPLCCPFEDRAVMVSSYVADFVYYEHGKRHVVDAKGHRDKVYKLKRKWLRSQDGVTIEEV